MTATLEDVLGVEATLPRPGWVVIDAIRDRRFTGEIVVDVGTIVTIYADGGRIYAAARDSDAPIGERLVAAGALDAAELAAGSIEVAGHSHLGRLFDRLPHLDHDRVQVMAELLTEECIGWMAGRRVMTIATTPYRHHPAGIHRWSQPALDVAGELLAPPQAAVAAPPPPPLVLAAPVAPALAPPPAPSGWSAPPVALSAPSPAAPAAPSPAAPAAPSPIALPAPTLAEQPVLAAPAAAAVVEIAAEPAPAEQQALDECADAIEVVAGPAPAAEPNFDSTVDPAVDSAIDPAVDSTIDLAVDPAIDSNETADAVITWDFPAFTDRLERPAASEDLIVPASQASLAERLAVRKLDLGFGATPFEQRSAPAPAQSPVADEPLPMAAQPAPTTAPPSAPSTPTPVADWIDELSAGELADRPADPLIPAVSLPRMPIEVADRFEVIWPSGEVDEQFGGAESVEAPEPDADRRGASARVVAPAQPTVTTDVSPERPEGGIELSPSERDGMDRALDRLLADEASREAVADDLLLAVRRAVASIDAGSLAEPRPAVACAEPSVAAPPAPYRPAVPTVDEFESDLASTTMRVAKPAPGCSVFDIGSPAVPAVLADVIGVGATVTTPHHAAAVAFETAEDADADEYDDDDYYDDDRTSALRRLIGSLRRR